MTVALEYLGKSKTCVETPIIIISEVEEIPCEAIDPEIYQVNVVDHVYRKRSRRFPKLLFYRVRDSAPDGSSPRGYA